MKVISKKQSFVYFAISALIGFLVVLLGYFYGMGDGIIAVFRFLLCSCAFFTFVAAFSEHPTEPGEKFKSHYLVIAISILYFIVLLFSGYKLQEARFNKLMSEGTFFVSGYVRVSYEDCYRTCRWKSSYVYEIDDIEFTGVIKRESQLQKNYWVTFRVAKGDHSVFEIVSYDKAF